MILLVAIFSNSDVVKSDVSLLDFGLDELGAAKPLDRGWLTTSCWADQQQYDLILDFLKLFLRLFGKIPEETYIKWLELKQ